MGLVYRFCVTKFVLQNSFANVRVHGLVFGIFIGSVVVNLIEVYPQSFRSLNRRFKNT